MTPGKGVGENDASTSRIPKLNEIHTGAKDPIDTVGQAVSDLTNNYE